MDLKNLISKNNDDEKVVPPSQPQQLNHRTSQPRLSIHSLMNESTSNDPKSPALDANHAEMIPPKPTEKITNDNAPTIEQQVKPFLPSDESGIKTDTLETEIQPKNDGNILPEPKNSTESKEAQSENKFENDGNDVVVTEIRPQDNPPMPTKAEDLKEKSLDTIIDETGKNPDLIKKDSLPKTIQNVSTQIQKLEYLKKKEEIESEIDGKPKRYRTKPTWAQDFIPVINRATGSSAPIGINSITNKTLINSISKMSIPSITGSIPRNDFNKLVTEWIWANIEGIKQDFTDVPNVTNCIELELKLGNIWDKVQDRRIQLPINTECIIATDYVNQDCFFKPGITFENFNETKNFMNKIIKDLTESQQKSKHNDANNKIITENSHVIDLIASDSRRNDKPISGRVSLDIKTKRKTNSISKQRISDLYLYFPNTLFDLRLSLSLELPKELNDAAFENFKKRVSMEREKERISYIHQATFTRFDLTKVREKSNRVPKYELELEINTPELLRSMDNVMDDPLYFIDLVQAFLDNSRIITRHLSNTKH